MAGIGFKLNQIMKNRTIAGDILAFSYSAIVSAGPWIITSFTLWLLLSVLQSSNIYFNSAMIYSSVFSSLLTSGILMVETRLISDL
ncbi:MAG TPA: exopolysaccharide Pel transporter PelG, partial [Petrotogaceae bacterium]|nr:exopolysaccharide Pel transporter PelG [Petrotogaceae bacterium]